MHMLVDLVWPSCVWMLVAGEALVCVCRCGAWMFAEMLIHFRFGKFCTTHMSYFEERSCRIFPLHVIP
jgi:hypothetical protein